MIQKLLTLDLEHVLLAEDAAFSLAHVSLKCQKDAITVSLERPNGEPLSRVVERAEVGERSSALEERLVSAAILGLPFEEVWNPSPPAQPPSILSRPQHLHTPAPTPAPRLWRLGAGTQTLWTSGPGPVQLGAYLEAGRQWRSGVRVSAGPLFQGMLPAKVGTVGEADALGLGGRVQVERAFGLGASWQWSLGVAGVGMGLRASGQAVGPRTQATTTWSPWAGAHGVLGVEWRFGQVVVRAEGFGGHTLQGVRARANEEVVVDLSGPYGGVGLSVLRMF